jgi:DNA-binding HxlR family transcriptional regulator
MVPTLRFSLSKEKYELLFTKHYGADRGARSPMKSYGQRCPVARALDVVGDRWSLLVVRELMVGPRRYRDLQDGLPGIGTNVLATRLRELTEAGILARQQLPPPSGAAVYELTDAGRALGPVLGALWKWGTQHAPPPRRNDPMRPAWVLPTAAAAANGVTPGLVGELRVDAEAFTLTGEADRLIVGSGGADRADVVIAFGSDDLYDLLAGRRAARASRRRATVTGDVRLADELLGALHGTVTDPGGT